MARRLLACHFFCLPVRYPVPASSSLARAISRCGGPSSPPVWAPQGQVMKSSGKLGKRMLMRRTAHGQEDGDDEENDTKLEREIKKEKRQAKENANLIDADDSDVLRSICPESNEDNMNLWSGSEDDDGHDIPTEAHPNERNDSYRAKVFEFDKAPRYRTISELLKSEKEPWELSPGSKQESLL